MVFARNPRGGAFGRHEFLQELPAVPGGNKLHINLNADVNLHAGTTYSIKIDAALLGFGIYYADRVVFLDHNQNFTTEYVNGVARLGQQQQPFTFKFALRAPNSTGATADSNPTQSSDAPPPVQHVAITNARVVGVTDTTVTLAWSTDIAADSKASVRSQLNPLYVVGASYDPTFELEHTITVTGLIPNVNYFADVFSSQSNEIVLTTYTISFKTLTAQAQAPSAPVTPPTVAPNPPTTQTPAPNQPETGTNNTANPPTNSNPTANTPNTGTTSNNPNSTNRTNGNDAGGSSSNELAVGTGSDSNETSIKWQVPTGGEPINGYRIDIFDYDHNLERQIHVPAGTHIKEIAKLFPGVHHAVVYADNDGVYKKVAPSASFLLQSNNNDMLYKIIGLIILWAIGLGGYFRWKFKKEKTVLPPEEGYDPNR